MKINWTEYMRTKNLTENDHKEDRITDGRKLKIVIHRRQQDTNPNFYWKKKKKKQKQNTLPFMHYRYINHDVLSKSSIDMKVKRIYSSNS